MPVTLKDISKRVGRSVPTVSRALGDHADISLTTRREVQRVAREVGYEPSVTARHLQKQRTDTIALILSHRRELRFPDPLFSEFLSGIIEQMSIAGHIPNITVDLSSDEREAYLKQVRGRQADGYVIVCTKRKDDRIDGLREHDVPFVAFGCVDGDNDFPLVDEDGVRGIRLTVDHLVALGHIRLACIAEATQLTKSYYRVAGFLDGLAAHGLKVESKLIVETNLRQRAGHRATEALLEMADPPTAIVACNDLLALGAMGAAQKKGLVIGSDVSITGFDDIVLAEDANPGLTKVHQPAYEMGALVAGMLLRVINKKPIKEKQRIIQPSLVVRGSSGPPQPRMFIQWVVV